MGLETSKGRSSAAGLPYCVFSWMDSTKRWLYRYYFVCLRQIRSLSLRLDDHRNEHETKRTCSSNVRTRHLQTQASHYKTVAVAARFLKAREGDDAVGEARTTLFVILAVASKNLGRSGNCTMRLHTTAIAVAAPSSLAMSSSSGDGTISQRGLLLFSAYNPSAKTVAVRRG